MSPPMKMLKLIYIAHGYMLATHNKPLLDEPILNGQYGPIVKSVYEQKRFYRDRPIGLVTGAVYKATIEEIDIIHKVVDTYGEIDAITLSSAIRQKGTPWSAMNKRGMNTSVIPNDVIRIFYLWLVDQPEHSSL